jgi:hypothetical protein
VSFDGQQVGLRFGCPDFTVGVRKCSLVVALGVGFSIEPFDQRIVVQPSDQRDLVRHFGERECALLGIGYALHLNLRPDDLAIILDQQ